jgi:uncharacterized membrane protein
MKLKDMLLIAIILVMIPEILLTAYIFGRYSINLGLVESSTGDFLSFLMSNPLFFVVIIVVFIVMLILYFTLQIK